MKKYILIITVSFFGCQPSKYFPNHNLENYEEKLTIFTHESYGLLIYKYKTDNSAVKFDYDQNDDSPKMWFQIKDKVFNPIIKDGSVHILCEEGEMTSLKDYEFNTQLNTQIWNQYNGNDDKPRISPRGTFPVRNKLKELYGDKFLEMLDSQCN